MERMTLRSMALTAACSALCLGVLGTGAGAWAAEELGASRTSTSAVAKPPAETGNAAVKKAPRITITAPPRRVGKLVPGDFGMHSYQGKPGVPAGSYRHNCYPLWRTMNPAPGVYDWEDADQIIAESRAMGFTDVMFSFCGTPEWAAKGPVAMPEREYWGKYATAAPKDMGDWRTFLRAFVSRYSGQISTYEAWNEATAKYLWQGTPDEMAEMTEILYEVVADLDPTARVVSANSQMGEQPAWFRSFFPRYMAALAARNWPVDVVAIHSYAGHPDKIPPAEGVVKRAAVLGEFVRAAKKAGIPDRVQFWDTETNYLGKADPRLQQAMVLRTYLDSWRNGFKRTYWYMWVKEAYPWLGIQMMDGAPGVVAYTTLMSWTVGSTFKGCGVDGALRVCEFVRGGKTFRIAYAVQYSGKQVMKLPTATTVCEPTGAACRTTKRATVTYLPVKIG